MKKTAVYQRKRAGASRWANKWVQSPRWFIGFGIAVGVCLLVYLLNLLVGRVHPGSSWGVGYGIAATVLLFAVLLYGVRRRTMRFRRLGKTWTYLQLHVYGGGLFLLMVFMHTAFKVPQGVHTWWLWFFSLWVVGSGLLGIVFQKWIPTVLSTGLSIEVHYDRVPALITTIRERAEKLVASADERVRDFYVRNLAASLQGPQPRILYFFDITGGIHARLKPFAYLRALLSEADQDNLDALQQLYKTKLEIDAHYTLQKALRGWLVLHVPVSILLVVLLAFHIFSVLYY